MVGDSLRRDVSFLDYFELQTNHCTTLQVREANWDVHAWVIKRGKVKKRPEFANYLGETFVL